MFQNTTLCVFCLSLRFLLAVFYVSMNYQCCLRLGLQVPNLKRSHKTAAIICIFIQKKYMITQWKHVCIFVRCYGNEKRVSALFPGKYKIDQTLIPMHHRLNLRLTVSGALGETGVFIMLHILQIGIVSAPHNLYKFSEIKFIWKPRETKKQNGNLSIWWCIMPFMWQKNFFCYEM